jgi:hypothetical protein
MSIQADLLNPELGYHDEGVALGDPALYEGARRPFGKATILPPAAYRSKTFLELESEKIWTRSWAAIGLVQQVPNPGDLLPFTLGFHGLHIQRGSDGLLAARMNRHQHGGCRFVPVQCRTGMQTKCSITSCNYTRDSDAMSANENGENTDEMFKFVGLVPEKLQPVKFQLRDPFIFVNLDPEAGTLNDQIRAELPRVPGASQRPLSIRTKLWVDAKANWKEVGALFMAAAEIDEGTVTCDGPDFVEGTLVASDVPALQGLISSKSLARDTQLLWAFPNLLVATGTNHMMVAILQSTAPGKTLCRLFLLTLPTVSEDEASDIGFAWISYFRGCVGKAEELHQDHVLHGTASRPGTSAGNLPVEALPASYLLNRYVSARVCTEHKYYWNAPIMDAAMLMRGVR